jgi:hypothetical protein
LGKETEKRQQQNEDFFTDFHAIRLLSVCVYVLKGREKASEREKKAIGKEISNSIQANRF